MSCYTCSQCCCLLVSTIYIDQIKVLLDTNNVSIINPGWAKSDPFVSSIL